MEFTSFTSFRCWSLLILLSWQTLLLVFLHSWIWRMPRLSYHLLLQLLLLLLAKFFYYFIKFYNNFSRVLELSSSRLLLLLLMGIIFFLFTFCFSWRFYLNNFILTISWFCAELWIHSSLQFLLVMSAI